MSKMIYVIGSLRNEQIPTISNTLRAETGFEVFDDWFSPGPEADDFWKKYEEARGRTYEQALKGWAGKHVYEFDKYHIDRADIGVLIMPAGKSGHLELGYMVGRGKPGYILYPGNYKELAQLPPGWDWFAGLYEGEGSLSRNKNANGHALALSITSTDKDVIERIYDITKVGNIQGPYINKGNNLISAKKKGWEAKEQWRWSVYKKDDIFYVIRGIWKNLGERRKQQIMKNFTEASMNDEFIFDNKTPYEFRWDVMYQFATSVFFNEADLIAELKKQTGEYVELDLHIAKE